MAFSESMKFDCICDLNNNCYKCAEQSSIDSKDHFMIQNEANQNDFNLKKTTI